VADTALKDGQLPATCSPLSELGAGPGGHRDRLLPTNGLSITRIVEGGDCRRPGERVWPRRLRDVVVAASGVVLLKAGVLIDREAVKLWKRMVSSGPGAFRPSPLRNRYGGCAQCSAEQPPSVDIASQSANGGVSRLQSLGEPGPSLTSVPSTSRGRGFTSGGGQRVVR